ncbi:zinc ribbon domain-containing protein [Yoonia sp. SS1-5]|uniref:Zinc ribbon domain-containing protein n=1 Tax=Yoonia rhodophyticola TaxID=3137370 RepID=A0AAN0NJL7_9RHOB
MRNQRVYEILTRCLYSGCIEHIDWGVLMRNGHHEGLTDFRRYQKIQDRLVSTAKALASEDISSDFPLRGFVQCDDCGEALTACWSTSKPGKKHPYCLCKTEGCDSYCKSIRRDQLEGDFAGLMQAPELSRGLFQLAKAMFRDIWNARLAQAADTSKGLKKDIHKIEKQIEARLDRIVEHGSSIVIAAIEKRIPKLEADKIFLEERIVKGGKPLGTLEESFELALRFLSNPWNMWKNGSFAW